MRPPRPTTVALLHPGGPVDAPLPRRLAQVEADVVVVAAVPVDPADAPSLRERARRLLDQRLGVAMVVGLVTDPDSGEPWPVPPGLAFTAHPLPPTVPEPDGGRRRTLLPGALWAARTEHLAEVGGLGADLPEPFAGIDLAWRLWLAGHEVVLDPELAVPGPRPVLWDRPTGDAAVEAEVAALTLLHRHLDDVSLAAGEPVARELSRVRLAARAPGTPPDAVLARVDGAARRLHHERYLSEQDRRRPDAEVLGLFGAALAPDDLDGTFVEAHAGAVAARPDLRRFAGRRRIVVATADSLSERMAGPAIRATRIARALASAHEVRLVSLTRADLHLPDVEVAKVDVEGDALDELVEWCDVFVFQGWVLAARDSVPRSDRVFVADIYDPLHLEQLEQSRDGGEHSRRLAVRHATAVLNDQLIRGDFLLCASEKQRDLWLGQLAALGRVNTATYDADPDLRALLDVAPFGIEDEPPVRTGPGIRGVVPGVGPDDQVVLWGGGIYNWFDPLTLVRAVDRIRTRHPRLRLVFMGMRHPNPDVPEMRMAVATRALADELGLTGTHVFFNEGWVPYEERQNHLLDADVAVSTHYRHVETAFSFRTRILDYLWASLPVVCTEGDALADLVGREQLGITVPPEDVDALADALSALLGDAERAAACRANIEQVTPALRWARVLEPLVAFCADPRRAPDHMQRLVDPTYPDVPLLLRGAPPGRGPSVLTRDLALLRRHLAEGGPRLAVERLAARARRLTGR